MADFALHQRWSTLGEWAIDGSCEAFAALSRVDLGDSWFPYVDRTPLRRAVAGSRVAARDLSVQLPFDLLFSEDPPPTSVRTWTSLVGWLSQARTYAAVCRRQQASALLLASWWTGTWSVCPHLRAVNVLPHSCQLCGDLSLGLGCNVCCTHVCSQCHTLNESGWPSNGRLAQRPAQRRNLSLRGMVRVREALESVTSRLDPLEQGDVPRALVALWVQAHASEGGAAGRFLLAPWL